MSSRKIFYEFAHSWKIGSEFVGRIKEILYGLNTKGDTSQKPKLKTK